jgi:hypothetical protein
LPAERRQASIVVNAQDRTSLCVFIFPFVLALEHLTHLYAESMHRDFFVCLLAWLIRGMYAAPRYVCRCLSLARSATLAHKRRAFLRLASLRIKYVYTFPHRASKGSWGKQNIVISSLPTRQRRIGKYLDDSEFCQN